MSMLRRTIFTRLCLLGFPNLLFAARSNAFAETYQYDALGRVIRVTYADGSTIEFCYDRAGNRTQMQRPADNICPALPPPPPPPGFNATIVVTGAAPVNLRALANAANYNGGNANVVFQVASGTTIIGAAGNPIGGVAIETGTWPTGPSVALTLEVSGKVYGGGGKGGAGSNTGSGSAGALGGDALYCLAPITVVINAGGEIKSGGGGGGGGGRFSAPPPATTTVGGDGGGGGFPNGPGGVGSSGTGGDAAVAGSSGTISGGGAGGASGPAGGAGGGAGAAGVNGTSASGGAGGAGGAGGYAIRKNGRNVTVTNNGTIAGTVG